MKKIGFYGRVPMKSKRKATAEPDTFCQATHGFAVNKGLRLLQIHNCLQRFAGCWQGSDIIPDTTGTENEKGKMG